MSSSNENTQECGVFSKGSKPPEEVVLFDCTAQKPACAAGSIHAYTTSMVMVEGCCCDSVRLE